MTLPQKRLLHALHARTPTIGSWLQTGSAAAAEILAHASFAWLGLDCEHTSADITTVEQIARALGGRDTALLVRVSHSDPIKIRRCLDVGAGGVIVPMVESAAQARQAVLAAKYPPVGTRGYGFGRMNEWGGRLRGLRADGIMPHSSICAAGCASAWHPTKSLRCWNPSISITTKNFFTDRSTETSNSSLGSRQNFRI